MKISVCIPTFNAAAYIKKCLHSLLEQRGPDFEVIVSDNASEDSTLDIVQSFRDSRIRTFRSDRNVGMAGNFNRALYECRGEYIKVLCADDIVEPDALKIQADFLDAHSGIPMSTGATRLIDSADEIVGNVRWFSHSVVVSAKDLKRMSLIYGNVVGEPSAVLFRKDAWLKAGPFRDGLLTLIDLDMWFRLSDYGGVAYVPTYVCRIRRHASSMTSQFRGAGQVQDVVLHMTEKVLSDLRASTLARRISLGKVAGSHIRHAIYGLRRGQFNWPPVAIRAAFQIDPGFIGLLLYLVLFRPGALGLRIGNDGRLSVGMVNTLHCASEGR